MSDENSTPPASTPPSSQPTSSPCLPEVPTAPPRDDLWELVTGLSVAVCLFHGYRRSGLWGAVLWGAAGTLAPFAAPAAALALGYAMPEKEADAWRAQGYPARWSVAQLRTALGV